MYTFCNCWQNSKLDNVFMGCSKVLGSHSKTPNWRLAQNVKVYQVSGPSWYFRSRPKSPKDKHLTYKKASVGCFQGSADLMSMDGSKTWYTFTFWANLQLGVEMRPQKYWAALLNILISKSLHWILTGLCDLLHLALFCTPIGSAEFNRKPVPA